MNTVRLIAIVALLTLAPVALADPAPATQPAAGQQVNCPVSGEPLGSMGDPITVSHEGREIKLCCDGCIKKFKKDPVKYIEKVDAEIKQAKTPAAE